MINFLRHWTMSLAGIIVFGSLCEILLPNNIYKKYINLAIGLMLCVALISPFIKGEYDLNIPVASSSINSVEMENKDTLSVFSKKICRSLEEFVCNKTGLKLSARCEVSDNPDNFGKIENIYLIIQAEGDKRINDSVIEEIALSYGVSKENISVKYMS